ncbi:MAG TPA: dihydropteroate synthase [Methylovirgula sp.]|nr:dihydropteroate synthase [Methylovirgula sp.]
MQQQKRDDLLALMGERSIIMGILNVTPDSFSDGGKFQSREAALAQARKLAADGADIIDVGAESTRPGHVPVPEEVELARLNPMLADIVGAVERPVSIDTYKAAVARRALELGAVIVNDVWGMQKDPAMADTVAEAKAIVVVMHNRESVDPDIDIIADMRRFFDHSLDLAERAGIPRRHIILDPGIGFGKTKEQNLAALRGLDGFLEFYGLPLLVGVSRKSLFGPILGSGVDGRLIGTLAANLIAAAHGATIFRVHDAAEHVAAFKVYDAIEHG